MIGEMSLIDGKPRSATVKALTDLRTLVVPSWKLGCVSSQKLALLPPPKSLV